MFIPVGQTTQYAQDWIGRYQVQEVTLETVDIRPAASYAVSDWLSLGVGIDAIYTHFLRTSAIDFGALCFGKFGTDGLWSGRTCASSSRRTPPRKR